MPTSSPSQNLDSLSPQDAHELLQRSRLPTLERINLDTLLNYRAFAPTDGLPTPGDAAEHADY